MFASTRSAGRKEPKTNTETVSDTVALSRGERSHLNVFYFGSFFGQKMESKCNSYFED